MRISSLRVATLPLPLERPIAGARPTQTLVKSAAPCDCEDTVEISEEGKEASDAASADAAEQSSKTGELTPEEQQQVEELKQRDREVRAHEQAHLSAAGQYASGGPTFTYQQGPDGRRYAIGGEVQIDTSPIEGDPEATIRKAQVIRSAANAPAEPSSQDRNVAAQASQLEAQARAELAQQQRDEQKQSAEGETIAPVGTLLNLVA
ncbi:MAG: putative metalloprotease CJM1_0395 family protein [Pirellulaceae bacterium]